MSETINSNIHPGYPNTLVDEVGELEKPEPKPAPKKKAAKKAEDE